MEKPVPTARRTDPRRLLLQAARAATRPVYFLYERELTARVKAAALPRHLGLILDGNRRFARSLGVDESLGHEFGVDKAHEVLGWCLELGIKNVTIWVLSTDNLNRDPHELEHLMKLFAREARNLAVDPRIHNNHVRVRAIGQHGKFPEHVLDALRDLESATAKHEGMLLNIAVGYGGREEIVDAVRAVLLDADARGVTARELADTLSPGDISERLYTAGTPDPDFIIRTSGEVRLGGFLLWQGAYSEYYFCDALWPEFRRIDFLRALRNYQDRHRRFGK
ncbi:MAG TPA: isoprenyl transferase [Deinococcales bacterium]|nr:isoprenyl transferase [Deinococcales bacterium]